MPPRRSTIKAATRSSQRIRNRKRAFDDSLSTQNSSTPSVKASPKRRKFCQNKFKNWNGNTVDIHQIPVINKLFDENRSPQLPIEVQLPAVALQKLQLSKYIQLYAQYLSQNPGRHNSTHVLTISTLMHDWIVDHSPSSDAVYALLNINEHSLFHILLDNLVEFELTGPHANEPGPAEIEVQLPGRRGTKRSVENKKLEVDELEYSDDDDDDGGIGTHTAVIKLMFLLPIEKLNAEDLDAILDLFCRLIFDEIEEDDITQFLLKICNHNISIENNTKIARLIHMLQDIYVRDAAEKLFAAENVVFIRKPNIARCMSCLCSHVGVTKFSDMLCFLPHIHKEVIALVGNYPEKNYKYLDSWITFLTRYAELLPNENQTPDVDRFCQMFLLMFHFYTKSVSKNVKALKLKVAQINFYFDSYASFLESLQRSSNSPENGLRLISDLCKTLQTLKNLAKQSCSPSIDSILNVHKKLLQETKKRIQTSKLVETESEVEQSVLKEQTSTVSVRKSTRIKRPLIPFDASNLTTGHSRVSQLEEKKKTTTQQQERKESPPKKAAKKETKEKKEVANLAKRSLVPRYKIENDGITTGVTIERKTLQDMGSVLVKTVDNTQLAYIYGADVPKDFVINNPEFLCEEFICNKPEIVKNVVLSTEYTLDNQTIPCIYKGEEVVISLQRIACSICDGVEGPLVPCSNKNEQDKNHSCTILTCKSCIIDRCGMQEYENMLYNGSRCPTCRDPNAKKRAGAKKVKIFRAPLPEEPSAAKKHNVRAKRKHRQFKDYCTYEENEDDDQKPKPMSNFHISALSKHRAMAFAHFMLRLVPIALAGTELNRENAQSDAEYISLDDPLPVASVEKGTEPIN